MAFSLPIILLIVLDLAILILLALLFQRKFGGSSQLEALTRLTSQTEALSGQFSATVDRIARATERRRAFRGNLHTC